MNRQFTSKLLLLFLIGFASNFCSDPVKVGEDTQDNVTISSIVINNVVDNDADDFYAAVNLSFTINTEKNMNLRANVGYKGTEDTEYQAYSYYFTFDANGTKNISITLDSEDHSFSSDCYEFIIWIYEETDTDQENLLASISASEDEDLYLCMESYDDDQPLTLVTFKNNGHAPMDFTVSGYGTKSADPGGSTSFAVAPGIQYYSVYTIGSYKGSDVGISLSITNDTLNISNNPRTINININANYFFLYYTNALTVNVYPLEVNYGTTAQMTEYITIPNDNIQYGLGYYEAYTNTEIRFYTNYPSQYQYAIQGTHFTFSWTTNQSVSLYSSGGSLNFVDIKDQEEVNKARSSNIKYLSYEK